MAFKLNDLNHQLQLERRTIEAQYRELLEDLPLPFCRISPACRLLYVNQTYCDYFKQSAENLLGALFLEAVPEWERHQLHQQMQNLVPQQPVMTFECRMSFPNEEVRWQQWTVRAIYDEERLLEWRASMVDITDSKKITAIKLEQHLFTKVMLDISTLLNSTLEFEEVMQSILENLRRVLPYDSANIMLIENGYTHVVAHWGYLEPHVRQYILETQFSVTQTATFNHMLTTRSFIIVPDMEPQQTIEGLPTVIKKAIRSYMGVPIVAGQEIIGFLNVDSVKPTFFDVTQAQRLQLFADQAGVAIKNAQLYHQARELAAAEERQRLARELHDAVNQTLFAANLLTDALGKVYEKTPQQLPDLLRELHSMTRSAQVEMRTLLIELHPEALSEIGLGELMQQLGATFAQRHAMQVQVKCEGEGTLPPQVQMVLYRVIQARLHRIAKEARASQVWLQLSQNETRITLIIKDNGQPTSDMMVEDTDLQAIRARAAEIAAQVDWHTQPTEGTEIKVMWMKEVFYGQ